MKFLTFNPYAWRGGCRGNEQPGASGREIERSWIWGTDTTKQKQLLFVRSMQNVIRLRYVCMRSESLFATQWEYASWEWEKTYCVCVCVLVVQWWYSIVQFPHINTTLDMMIIAIYRNMTGMITLQPNKTKPNQTKPYWTKLQPAETKYQKCQKMFTAQNKTISNVLEFRILASIPCYSQATDTALCSCHLCYCFFPPFPIFWYVCLFVCSHWIYTRSKLLLSIHVKLVLWFIKRS